MLLRVTVLAISDIKQKNKGKSSTQVGTSTLKFEPTVRIELQQILKTVILASILSKIAPLISWEIYASIRLPIYIDKNRMKGQTSNSQNKHRNSDYQRCC